MSTYTTIKNIVNTLEPTALFVAGSVPFTWGNGTNAFDPAVNSFYVGMGNDIQGSFEVVNFQYYDDSNVLLTIAKKWNNRDNNFDVEDIIIQECKRFAASIVLSLSRDAKFSANGKVTGTSVNIYRDLSNELFGVILEIKHKEYISNYCTTSPTITLVANTEQGQVFGGGKYKAKSTANIIAVPKVGYEFVNWTESAVEQSTDANYNFEVAGNRILTANFQAV